MKTRERVLPILLLVTLAMAARAAAQVGQSEGAAAGRAEASRELSLDDALRLAEQESEQVEIAAAAVQRAQGNVVQARSSYLPQLNSSLSYARTLESQFRGVTETDSTSATTPCDPFTPDPTTTIGERLSAVEQQLQCPATGGFGGLNLGKLGFGAPNAYNLGLSFSQPIFAGGRILAQNRAAQAGRSASRIGLSSALAQLRLDVTQAYYNAELADRLAEIAQAVLDQANATLELAQLQQQVGTTAEFDVLRARVARDNQRPVVIQAQSARDLAYMRLKQMLNIPLNEPLTLTTRLGESVPPESAAVDTAGLDRAPVRQTEESLRAQEAQLRIARSQFLPTVSLTSQYGRVAYPGSLLPQWDEFRSNWSIGLAMSLPLFTGGRLRGQAQAAEANVREARAQLQQIRELAELDTRTVLEQLRASRASLEASSGTVEQAQRAYEIAELRYREGISTQVELSDARLLLQQAQVNRAQAERDYQIARMKVELLPDLPLTTASAPSGGASGPGGGSAAAQGQSGAGAGGSTGFTSGSQPSAGGTAGGAGIPTGVPGQSGGGAGQP